MADEEPVPYEGETVDAEIVEGDIWASCVQHHRHHCLTCFPHEPWRVEDPLLEAIEQARQSVRDHYSQYLQQAAARLINQLRDRKVRYHRGLMRMWIVILLVNLFSLGVDIVSENPSFFIVLALVATTSISIWLAEHHRRQLATWKRLEYRPYDG